MCIKIYKKCIFKHENIQIYRNACRKIFVKIKRVYKKHRYKNMYNV